MFNQFDEMIIRQRTVELNRRLDRLYVPADLGEKTRGARLSFGALRGWLTRASTARVQRGRSAAHGVPAK